MAFPEESLPKINRMSQVMIEECEKNNRLLPHQIEALRKLSLWFGGCANDIALVCMPTGSGKTGVIACLPYYLASIQQPETNKPRYLFDKPVLVVAPDRAIQSQLLRELTLKSTATPFLIRTGIVPSDRRDVLPNETVIETTAELKNQQYLKSKELVITNVQKFNGEDWINALDSNLFRLVVIDEAHHHPATTWRRIVHHFRNSECPVVFLTATPYRTDRQLVLGEEGSIAYRLSLEKAVDSRIIRQSHFEEVTEVRVPAFLETDTCKVDRISAGNMFPILEKVKELLDHKRKRFRDAPHMAIAICGDTKQAELLLELWRWSYPDELAETYHSDLRKHEKDRIMKKLRRNSLSLVVIVGMLLEGFDHPPISIAAITYKLKSPVRFVQFVGRAQRIYRQKGYNEPQELRADIVTHENYKQGPNYNNFITEAMINIAEDV